MNSVIEITILPQQQGYRPAKIVAVLVKERHHHDRRHQQLAHAPAERQPELAERPEEATSKDLKKKGFRVTGGAICSAQMRATAMAMITSRSAFAPAALPTPSEALKNSGGKRIIFPSIQARLAQ